VCTSYACVWCVRLMPVSGVYVLCLCMVCTSHACVWCVRLMLVSLAWHRCTPLCIMQGWGCPCADQQGGCPDPDCTASGQDVSFCAFFVLDGQRQALVCGSKICCKVWHKLACCSLVIQRLSARRVVCRFSVPVHVNLCINISQRGSVL